MRWLLVLLLALFGCDDPDVSAKAAAVLEHGVVEAEVACAGSFVRSGDGSFPFTYRLAKLIDGSAHISTQAYLTRESVFYSRTALPVDFATVSGAFNGITFTVADGSLSLDEVTGADIDETIDLSLECTGFNLEAFGVEP